MSKELHSTETKLCPHCGGTGKLPVSQFKAGDRVVWRTGGWWGDKLAVVIALSKSGARVRIRTEPHIGHNGGNPWTTYVSPNKLDVAP